VTCCTRPKRWRQSQLQACCTWQRNIRANGWLEISASYRGLFALIERMHPNLCQRTAVTQLSDARAKRRNGDKP